MLRYGLSFIHRKGKGQFVMIIGAQAIVFGEELIVNLDENLDTLKKNGFTLVEAGSILLEDEGGVERVASLLENHRMGLSAFHVGIRSVFDSTEFSQLCEQSKSLKCESLICSGILYGGETRRYYVMTGQLLKERTREAGKLGIKLHYHHHDWELVRTFRDSPAIDVLFENADKSTGFVIDTYWLDSVRQDLPELWERLGRRCTFVHLKDGMPDELTFAPLGKGDCPVSDHFRFLRSVGVRVMIWEQDRATDQSIAKCVEVSGAWIRERLRENGNEESTDNLQR